jgi:hypothetical protein
MFEISLLSGSAYAVGDQHALYRDSPTRALLFLCDFVAFCKAPAWRAIVRSYEPARIRDQTLAELLRKWPLWCYEMARNAHRMRRWPVQDFVKMLPVLGHLCLHTGVCDCEAHASQMRIGFGMSSFGEIRIWSSSLRHRAAILRCAARHGLRRPGPTLAGRLLMSRSAWEANVRAGRMRRGQLRPGDLTMAPESRPNARRSGH